MRAFTVGPASGRSERQAMAPGIAADDVSSPGAGLPVWPAPREPALPVGTEGLLGVANLAALDLYDQAPASVRAARSLVKPRLAVCVPSLRRATKRQRTPSPVGYE